MKGRRQGPELKFARFAEEKTIHYGFSKWTDLGLPAPSVVCAQMMERWAKGPSQPAGLTLISSCLNQGFALISLRCALTLLRSEERKGRLLKI